MLAIALGLEPRRDVDPLVCVLLVGAYAVACNVWVAVPNRGTAPANQVAFVPMLLLAPLNLVPLLVLAGNFLDSVVTSIREQRPLARCVLSLTNTAYCLAPVLVLAVAGYETFTWSDWPLYVVALAAQFAFHALFTVLHIRLHLGTWTEPETLYAPTVIDAVLSVPALAVVAVADEAPVAATLTLAALLAIAAGFTSERGRRLVERESAARDARRALVDERVRIARELHDVVAHHVSVIGVQAGAARLVLDRDPDKAKETLASIETSSREAVHELHQLLGFLRQAHDGDDRGPQPGLGQLDELVASICDAGIDVEVRVEGEPYDLLPTVDASAYRIVQEALTNTLKHAGALRIAVSLRYQADALELEIVDDGDGAPAPSTSGGGLGLVGMRERASLHGGRLTAGPRAAGGFEVRATLPLPGAAP